MKLLFTDLDGTLLNDDSRISSGTKAFLDDFLLAGNKLILASGRPLLSVLEVKEKAGLTQSGIFLTCNNGTLIYDCDRSLSILEKRLPLSYVPYLQEQADKYHLHIQTYRDDAIVSPAEDAEIQYYRRKIHLPLIISPALQDALTEGPYKMLAISLDAEVSPVGPKRKSAQSIPTASIWSYLTGTPERAALYTFSATTLMFPSVTPMLPEMPTTISPCS